jgi:hypothetical protein
MIGSFVERNCDTHLGLREALLGGSRTAPTIGDAAPFCARDVFVAEFGRSFRRELDESGLVCVRLDEPFDVHSFAAFGRQLGMPIAETDPAVLPRTEHGCVLNIASEYAATEDVARQPFATGYLTLHTESSGHEIPRQPRYIVLMCCEPGDAEAAALTVLVPMAGVVAQMAPAHVATLAATRYRLTEGSPAILREVGARRVFSFRDFQRDPLEWLHAGQERDEEAVNAAFRGLLTAMYSAPAMALAWARGMLAIIDNQFFFHGKTSARGVAAPPRRLQRIRVRA